MSNLLLWRSRCTRDAIHVLAQKCTCPKWNWLKRQLSNGSLIGDSVIRNKNQSSSLKHQLYIAQKHISLIRLKFKCFIKLCLFFSGSSTRFASVIISQVDFGLDYDGEEQVWISVQLLPTVPFTSRTYWPNLLMSSHHLVVTSSQHNLSDIFNDQYKI